MESSDQSVAKLMKKLADQVNYGEHVVPYSTDKADKIHAAMDLNSQRIYQEMTTQFEGQKDGAFCGVASAAICLRHLFNSVPEKHAQFTQEAMYNKFIKNKMWKTKTDIRYGLTLDQIADLIGKAGGPEVTAKSVRIPDITALETKMKADLTAVFTASETQKMCMIINFCRDYKGHKGGHFCPVAGYSKYEGTEYAFILDVATHRSEPHWFPIKQLIPLMCRFDGKLPRGYILISKALTHLH